MFENKSTAKKVFLSSLLGIGTSLTLSFILLIVFSVTLLFSKDPAKLYLPVALTVMYFSSAVGGVISRYLSETNISGLFSGLGLTLIILTVSILSKNQANTPPAIMILAYSSIFISHITSVFLTNYCLNTKSKKRKYKRRR